MPATSVRDVIVKNDDLVAATHGRGFWILDDITPLREAGSSVASSSAYLFKPETALRVRWDTNTDTPIPPDEPAGKNPPDGAIVDYYLDSSTSGPVTLEILDSAGKLVRRYSSTDPIPEVNPMLDIPKYWVRPPEHLSDEAGMHRFLWDMHYPSLPEHGRGEYPMQAVFHDTAPARVAPWVMSGSYTVKLTADGKTYTQPLTVKMDPRVLTPAAGLLQQFTLSKQIYDDLSASNIAALQLASLRSQLAEIKKQSPQGTSAEAIEAFDKKALALEGAPAGRFGGRGAAPAADTLNLVNGQLGALMQTLQEADVTPTTAEISAVTDRRQALAKLMARWRDLTSRDRPALNVQLKQANLPEVVLDGNH
jgi:hypothetical protein